jgi:hypothetical protein
MNKILVLTVFLASALVTFVFVLVLHTYWTAESEEIKGAALGSLAGIAGAVIAISAAAIAARLQSRQIAESRLIALHTSLRERLRETRQERERTTVMWAAFSVVPLPDIAPDGLVSGADEFLVYASQMLERSDLRATIESLPLTERSTATSIVE